jgi:hypothetical protein
VVFTEIDKRILKINPVLIGSGIPLFDGVADTRAMNLAEHKIYTNGFALARYDFSPRSRATNVGVTHSVVVTDRRREKLSITSSAIAWPGAILFIRHESDGRTRGPCRASRAAAILEWPVSVRGRSDDLSQSPCSQLSRGSKLLILNGEMSEWLKEHAWKFIPDARADAHQILPAKFRSTASRNNDVHLHVLVNQPV